MPTVIPESRNVIIKAGVELSMITGLALPMIVLHLIIKDYQPTVRGFFCDDENIKHPYKEVMFKGHHSWQNGISNDTFYKRKLCQ